jgi:membrane-associated phospholipid phosphatase
MLLRRPRNALIGASVCLGLLLLTWLLAFHVAFIENVDQAIFKGFNGLSERDIVYRVATSVAHLCDPQPYVYLAAIPLLIALARRRFRLAIAIGAILLGANATTELLKPMLAQPRAGSLFGGVSPVGPSSWPSGHATAVMSWALCTILAAPPRIRSVVAALGAALAVAVCYSFLVLGWHYPSDVLGGYLVATMWTLLGVAAMRATELPSRRRRPVEDRAREAEARVSLRAALAPPVLALAFAVVLAALLAVARPQAVNAYAHAHGAFMIGAAAIGVLALTLATGMVLALRR